MARKANVRTVVNRQALAAIEAGLVDGLETMGGNAIGITNPPDATPFGEGLVTSGDWGVWAYGRKVAGGATKPRSVRLSKTAIVLLVGYGFPGRFQNNGTVNQRANPFLSRTFNAIAHLAPEYLRPAVAPALRRGR